jgi:hypothetical protein
MDDSRWERWSALGGILFVVLILASAFVPGSPPKASDSAAKIAKFVTDKHDEIRWAAYLSGLAAVALLWFSGAVWRFLRRAEGGSPRLTVVSVLGAGFALVMGTIGAVVLGVLGIVGVAGSGGAAGARVLYLLSFNITGTIPFGVAVFVGAFSLVVIRSRVLPVALGWIGVLLAVVFVVGGGVVASTRDIFFNLQFGGFLVFSLWLIVVSFLMFRADAELPVASTT